jgi:hypothetical protein
MVGKSDVLLTADDVSKWREKDKELAEQIRQLEQRRAEVKRKLEAAEVFVGAPYGEAAAPVSNGHDTEDTADSAPVALVANLRKTGDSLKVQGIKARLIELGFGDKIKAQPNYHYSLAYRLTRSGKLIKRGSKYRAAPIRSPEGETEANGASVRH